MQPSDIYLNKSFKLYVIEKYDEWMTNGVHECTTCSGNMKVPLRKMIVKWILDSWKELDEEIIVKSFKAFVLNLNVSELRDRNIYFFKKYGPCQEGYSQLQTHLNILYDENDANPFSATQILKWQQFPSVCWTGMRTRMNF